MREQVYVGKTLSEKQGKDRLPAAPPPNPVAVTGGATAPPDPMAAADLQKQEHDVQTGASPDSGSDN
jgi:hypothetical protein